MTTPLFHYYHVYADGNYTTPVAEHFNTLRVYGLTDALDSIQVGIVGSDENREAAKQLLAQVCPTAQVCAEAESGWEQTTLNELWAFSHDNEGYVSYAHTKGASRDDPIDRPWRRDMTYHNFVNWQHVVNLLSLGQHAVGCHWIKSPAANPDFGWGGMFGGNFWWSRLDLLRQNCHPQMHTRFAAEHWLFQLSEVLPMTEATITDLNPQPIQEPYLKSDW